MNRIISKKFNIALLEHIVCPITSKPLRYDQDNHHLISDKINVIYPIGDDNIPILLPEKAYKLNDAPSSQIKKD